MKRLRVLNTFYPRVRRATAPVLQTSRALGGMAELTWDSNQGRTIADQAQLKPTQIQFKMLNSLTQGKDPVARLQSASKFLRKELPIRLAKLIVDLKNLPYGLSSTKSIRRVTQLYVNTFNQIYSHPEIRTEEDAKKFTAMLDQILRNHKFVVPMTAMGVLEMKKTGAVPEGCPFLDQFMNNFFTSRVVIRTLIGHLVVCQQNYDNGLALTGEIDTDLDIHEVLKAAAEDAKMICQATYGRCPEIKIKNMLDRKVTYIAGHSHVIAFELMKNSLRAVCEFHKDGELPPIKVICVGGVSDVTIKIEDEGGGIPLADMEKIWSYTYTSTPFEAEDKDEESLVNALKSSLVWSQLPGHQQVTGKIRPEDEGPLEEERGRILEPSQIAGRGGGVIDAPMSGFGYGLPISRLYAKFFGGNCALMSAPGHGTDAFIYLPYIEPEVTLP